MHTKPCLLFFTPKKGTFDCKSRLLLLLSISFSLIISLSVTIHNTAVIVYKRHIKIQILVILERNWGLCLLSASVWLHKFQQSLVMANILCVWSLPTLVINMLAVKLLNAALCSSKPYMLFRDVNQNSSFSWRKNKSWVSCKLLKHSVELREMDNDSPAPLGENHICRHALVFCKYSNGSNPIEFNPLLVRKHNGGAWSCNGYAVTDL